MWHALTSSPAERRAVCDAIRFVLGDGPTDPREQALLELTAELLGGRLEPRVHDGPEALAAALPPPLRERALQSAMLATLMDEVVSPDEDLRVQALARAFALDEPRLRALHHVAHQRQALAFLDLARRSFARDAFEDALARGGPGKLWKIVGPLVGLAGDPELAQRYIGLGALPAGSLGRAYVEFVTRNRLSFPGEHRAVPEAGVWHDLTHVLAGYGTSDEEEILVVSFIAGYRRDDPFFWLFTIVLQYHLGIRVSPYSPRKTGLFRPRAAQAAYERGTHVTIDLERWDPWPHFHRPLAELRREFGVPPRTDANETDPP
jgi:hypothetical protein